MVDNYLSEPFIDYKQGDPLNLPPVTELEITVGHQTFSEQKCPMFRQFWFWSDIMSG